MLADLKAQVASFNSASTRKYDGLQKMVGSTQALEALIRSTVRKVRELGVIMRRQLRNDPELSAAWASATHIERAARKPKPSGPPTSTNPGPVAPPSLPPENHPVTKA